MSDDDDDDDDDDVLMVCYNCVLCGLCVVCLVWGAVRFYLSLSLETASLSDLGRDGVRVHV